MKSISKKSLFLAIQLCGLAGSSALWAAGAGHHVEPMPETGRIIAAFINLALFFILMIVIMRKPMKNFFASRAVLVKKDIEESQQLKKEAQAKHSEYEKRLQNIEQEMQNLVEELKKDGELESDKIISLAQEQAETLKSTHEKILSNELKKAKATLKEEAVKLASDLAEDLIKKQLTPEDQKRLISQYIEKMEKMA